MYHAKLWDEDKWNIHSNSYSSSKYGSIFTDDKDSKKESVKYHEQKYGQKEGDVSSDYMKKEENEDAKMQPSKDAFLSDEEENKKGQEIKEEDIPFKAAKQLFSEIEREPKKQEKKKEIKTIEDAIRKAIEVEKKVIIMDS